MDGGDDGGNPGEHERLQGEEPDVGEQHLLHHHEQLDDEHPCGKQGDRRGGEWGGGRAHGKRNVDSKARVARMKAALSKSGTRNRRSLALLVSTRTTAPARTSSLAINQSSDRPREAAVNSVGIPIGKKTFANKAISTSCLTEALHSMRAR